jgi:enoyl-[acyl-carrier protein] reductase II
MLKTPICDLFGIEHPILLAGMGGVSMAPLVAAVSNAGGLGVMGAAALSPDDLRTEIRKTRQLTKKPFAVDLLAPLPEMIVPYLPVLFEEEVKIFVAGLAVPEKYVADMKAHGMKIVVMTGKVKHAIRAEQAGADVVAAQGTEAGGHTGEIGTMALVPQVVDAVKIPVVAAGGIVDGRGVVAALALGAQGAVVGTRFIATPEATAALQYREAPRARRAGRDRAHAGLHREAAPRPQEPLHRRDRGRPEGAAPFPQQMMISVAAERHWVLARRCDPANTCFPAGRASAASRRSSRRATCYARSSRTPRRCCRRQTDAIRAAAAAPRHRGLNQRLRDVQVAVDRDERQQQRQDHGARGTRRGTRTPGARRGARSAGATSAAWRGRR